MKTDDAFEAVKWYRTPVPREVLSRLTGRSNFKGTVQTLGYLGLTVLTGGSAGLSIGRLTPVIVVLLFLLHGFVWSFMLNGFHELSHNTVFKSRGLNRFFFGLFSFLSWNSHVFFTASHRRHHAHTLYYPLDREVILPIRVSFGEFLARGIVNIPGFLETLWGTLRFSLGSVRGRVYSGLGSVNEDWLLSLFPAESREERKRFIRWARITLAGHLILTLLFLSLGYWYLPLVISCASFYGGGFLYFLNSTQHMGMQGNVSDFRLAARTILLNPVLSFLYWHMNYHLEHHMYASVPCYKLKELHKTVAWDTPVPPGGFFRTWKEIKKLNKNQAEGGGRS